MGVLVAVGEDLEISREVVEAVSVLRAVGRLYMCSGTRKKTRRVTGPRKLEMMINCVRHPCCMLMYPPRTGMK